MTEKTRLAVERRELVKSCIMDIIKDNEFIKVLRDSIAKEVDRVFADKIQSLEDRVSDLEEKNRKLSEKCDALEQYSRRTSVRIIGMKQCDPDRVEEHIKDLFREKLQINIREEAIDRCHSIGKPKNGTHNLIVKFVSYRDRRLVMQNKRKLKGSKITIVEDLTRMRYNLYREASNRFGYKSVWTMDGVIYILSNGKKMKITTSSDLNSI